MNQETKTHLKKVVDNLNSKSPNEQVTMFLQLPRIIALQRQRREYSIVQSLLIFQRMYRERFSEYVRLYGGKY